MPILSILRAFNLIVDYLSILMLKCKYDPKYGHIHPTFVILWVALDLWRKLMTENYFNNVDDLVQHILFKHPHITPLKLQKSLYFMFAVYSGCYRRDTPNLPLYLFDAQFQAWSSGPVILSVYNKFKSGEYQANKLNPQQLDENMSNFIENITDMIIAKSDFALSLRCHDDMAWQKAVGQCKNLNQTAIMNNDEIITEYKSIFETD